MASGTRVDPGRGRPPDHRARPHVRHGHRQDREPRADATKTPRGWFVGFGDRVLLIMTCSWSRSTYLLVEGHRHLGHQHPGRLGLRDHQLRLVDRHRPRRHADLGDPAAAAAAVAHVDQPLRRGDDDLRGGLRRHVPAPAHGPAVVRRLLAAALPEHDGPVAAVPEPADLGRVRGLDLRHGLAAVLVRRPASPTSRRCATARSNPLVKIVYGILALGWRGSARHWAQLRDGVPAPRRALDAAGRLRAHGRELRLRIAQVPGWHATIFPPYFVAGAIYSGFAMVLTLAIPLRKVYGLEDFITHAAPREHGAR